MRAPTFPERQWDRIVCWWLDSPRVNRVRLHFLCAWSNRCLLCLVYPTHGKDPDA